tara:strand:- start:349 stop:1656 length:1308 start_codon:yes stop_codon:yes gene_type:complete
VKTKLNKDNLINIITLGCAKNIYDSEVLMNQLNANKFHVKNNSTQHTPIVIINTCGFIDNAKEESINTILENVKKKKNGLIEKLYVTGCLSQRYKDDLKKEIPEVDEYFGTRNLPELLNVLKADYKKDLLGHRSLITPKHFAYLKISEGCNRKCSFCAIPLMRGKHISKSIDDLIQETVNLAAQGVKELILIAQDLSFYGLDLYKKQMLNTLLLKLCEVEGIEWIRLHYMYPTGFPKDILKTINNNSKICNYIDMPLQHISNKILKSMRRGINKNKTEDLIKLIRNSIDNVAIRTTFVVGSPGESDYDFIELKDWIIKTKFDRLGVFTYSHEEDTHFYNYKDDVNLEIKNKRKSEIMNIQRDISKSLNSNKIGNIYKVLFDHIEDGYFIGRTEFDSPDVDNEVKVKIDNNYIRIGDFANVKITKFDYYDLYGEVV